MRFSWVSTFEFEKISGSYQHLDGSAISLDVTAHFEALVASSARMQHYARRSGGGGNKGRKERELHG
jgi:hypothetical protein